MAGAGPGDLDLLAHDLKDVALEALDTIPDYEPTLSGAPDRAFVAPGLPVWDCCEQLAVHTQAVNDRFAKATPAFEKINIPNLVVTITRCVPEGELSGQSFVAPSVAELEAAAAQIHADGWALWNHIWNAIRAETFLTRCTEVTFVNMQAVAPAGGCGGWSLSFQAMLEGYEETFGS